MEESTNNKYAKLIKYIKIIAFDLIFLAIFAFIVLYEFPYVVYKPGSAINLSDRIKVDNDYEMEGSYSMNSVSVVSGNLPTLLMSFVMPNWDIVKTSDITYDDTSYEETLKIERFQLQNSMDLATIMAYEKAGYEVNIKSARHMIVYIDDNANTDLEILDEIKTIDDTEYVDLENLKTYIASKEIGDKIMLEVINNEKEYTRSAEVYELDGNKIIGISVVDDFEFDLSPELEIESKSDEAGSSGGLMMTLAIYDSLLEEDLTGGKNIMGTGTIEEDGSVGPIGGVKYKLLGAERDGCDVFFIPVDNYKEAKEVHEKNKLSFALVKVATLDEAIAYLHSQND